MYLLCVNTAKHSVQLLIGNATCYKRDYEVISFQSPLSFKPAGTNLLLNPRYRTAIQALVFQHIFENILAFCESQKLATSPYPEPDKSTQLPPVLY